MGKIRTDVVLQVSMETLIDLLKLKYSYKKIGEIVGMSSGMVQYACLVIYKIDTVRTKHYKLHDNIDEAINLYEDGWSLYRLADKYMSNDAYIKKVFNEIGVPTRDISSSLKISPMLRGENHYAWDDSLTDNERLSNRGLEYKTWAYKVKEQFDFKCDKCFKESDGDMVSHHLFNYKDNPSSRYDIDNGVCLCEKCHIAFHVAYGKKFNTADQYIEFKGANNGN